MTRHYANRPFLMQWFVLGMTTLLFGALLAFAFYQDHQDRELLERDRLRAQAQVMTANVGHLFR
ncbi:MAG: hypothetical protein HQL80_12140, partial [Magnetococcales bacterium]|nr:hypothetical protein [Magnetococcales bacterium]